MDVENGAPMGVLADQFKARLDEMRPAMPSPTVAVGSSESGLRIFGPQENPWRTGASFFFSVSPFAQIT